MSEENKFIKRTALNIAAIAALAGRGQKQPDISTLQDYPQPKVTTVTGLEKKPESIISKPTPDGEIAGTPNFVTFHNEDNASVKRRLSSGSRILVGNGDTKTHIATRPPANLEAIKTIGEEADKIVDHVKAEIEKAKAEGKPPLILFLEDHQDREMLAKQIAAMLKLKKELGIDKLRFELPKEQAESNTVFAKKASDIVIDTLMIEMGGQTISPDTRVKMEQNKKAIDAFSKEVMNQNILCDIAAAHGMQVAYTDYSGSDVEPRDDSKPFDVVKFIDDLAKIDKLLISQLEAQDKAPTILVTGTYHGVSLAEQVKDYHVIPVSFDEATIQDGPIVGLAKVGERLKDEGKPVDARCIAAADMIRRAEYAKNTAFLATKPLRLTGINAAITSAQAVIGENIGAGFWKSFNPPPIVQRTR